MQTLLGNPQFCECRTNRICFQCWTGYENVQSSVGVSFPGKPSVAEEIFASRTGQTKTERGVVQRDKKNMLRHLVEVNKKKARDVVPLVT